MKAILTYHSIDDSGSPISVDERSFRRHLHWLAFGDVPVVSLAELMALPADADAIALTFDDAFESFGTVAAPLVIDHGLTATVFVVTEHVGRTNAWGGADAPGIPTLPLLGWDALGRLAEQGIEIGAHTRTHPHLTDPRCDLADEIAGSGARLRAELGVEPVSFAYPYGSVGARAAACAASAYRWACTTELRDVRANDAPHRLPRLDMYYLREPGRLEAWGTARFRQYLWIRSQARRVRRSLAVMTESL